MTNSIKPYKTDFILFIGLIIIAISIYLISTENSPVDLQMHDTYIVLDQNSITFLIIGPLIFLVFLLRGIWKKLKNKWTNIGLLVGLIWILIFLYFTIQGQQQLVDQFSEYAKEEHFYNEVFVKGAKQKIKYLWVILSIITLGIFALGYWTIRIWNKVYYS
ncbi:hypothetical protein OO013_18235 [Mangrovivirga sp. M17]|uniref:Uncharacterized protein n=1 Tax=Mangrovivirga halotolerans TaxID=2993936 RepID=A0ABT3RW89_9BACT|nr:hypothetical protein [Mangrovivirga halotolerans]MCX2745827.1 hypothetical protein [Mangrovivirga halotolerans]